MAPLTSRLSKSSFKLLLLNLVSDEERGMCEGVAALS